MKGAIAHSQRCGSFEELIPGERLLVELERKFGEELILEQGIPKEAVKVFMRYTRMDVALASFPDELGQSVVLARHSFPVNRGKLSRSARRPAGSLEILPDRFPEGVELACSLFPHRGRGLRVRRANESFAEARVQVLGMEPEEDVAGLPDLAGRIEKLLFNGGMGSVIAKIGFVTPIDPMPAIDSRTSEERHAFILRVRAAVSPRYIVGSE
jgi:hypothetical protein